MSDQISLLRAAAHPDNTDGVTATTPTMRYRPEKCEFPIHIGLFFDGTRNKPGLGRSRTGRSNRNWRGRRTATSRVCSARILAFFSAYCHDSYAGFTPFDVSGAINWMASRNAPWEGGGYLQYRTRYAGESLRLAMLETYPQDEEAAAAA